MARSPLTAVLHHVRGLLGARASADLTDAQLLERFVAHRDEAAFGALLERHGPLVLGVCRQVLHDEHAAEDVFQATFLVLARKAGSVRAGQALGGWLYRVAVNLARTARIAAARRRAHERQAPDMAPSDPLSEAALRELRPVLHEEVSRLPEKCRRPVLLCYLEGQTHEQAAAALGWPVGTVRSRLSRARDLLLRRLLRRGVTAAALAVLLGRPALAAVPAALAALTARVALPFALGQALPAGAVSAGVLTFAEGALRTMTMNKLKMVVFLLVLGVSVTGAGVLSGRPLPEREPPPGTPGENTALPPAGEQPKKAAARVPTDPIPPIGLLGKQLGKLSTIEGVRAEGPKVDTSILLVDTVDGNKLGSPIRLRIDNVELPARGRCVLKGYESGKWEWLGTPPWVRVAEPRQAVSQFRFSRYFVVTSVEAPESLREKGGS
jgi:RNA polymerase sigma factor (sigma-70 family)